MDGFFSSGHLSFVRVPRQHRNPAVYDSTNGILSCATLPTGGRYDLVLAFLFASNCGGSVNLQVTRGVSEKQVWDAGNTFLESWKLHHDGDGVLTAGPGSLSA